MKKLTLLLALFTTCALFACLQASPTSAPAEQGVNLAPSTHVLTTPQNKKKRSSGVTVIIWP